MMKIIRFNAGGDIVDKDVKPGDVLIYLKRQELDFVEVTEPTKDYSLQIKDFPQPEELKEEAYTLIVRNFFECVNSNRHWWFTCPDELLDKMT